MGSSRCVCLWLSVGPALLLLISAALSLLRRPGPSVVALRMGLPSHCRLPAGECSVCLLVCLSLGPLEEVQGWLLMFSSLAVLPFGSCGRSSLPPTPQLPCATFLQEHVLRIQQETWPFGQTRHLFTRLAELETLGCSHLLCHCCCPPSIEGEPGLREAEHDPGIFYN